MIIVKGFFLILSKYLYTFHIIVSYRNTRYHALNIAILNYRENESFPENCKDYIVLFFISILQEDSSKDFEALTKLHFPQRQL